MKRICLNERWRFIANPTISVQSLAHNDILAGILVDLPHDAMIHEKRMADAPSRNQSGFYPGGIYCYVKMLNIPWEWENEHLVLEFEGIYKNALVYLNGMLAGTCRNGYTEFLVNMDPFLRYGQENEIKIMVNNSGQPSSRWYSGSGIYRNVNLLRASRTHLSARGVQLKTTWMDADLASVRANIELVNENPLPSRFTLKVELLNSEGEIAAKDELPVMMRGNSQETLYRTLQVHYPLLWDCEHPSLYHYRVVLEEENRFLDTEEGRFGIRTLAMDSARGLLLNGRAVKLRGACVHHDNGILGACSFEEAETRRIRIMKEAGFNCIRSAHNPASRAMLEACDTLGMLVMDEYADMWTVPKNAFDDAVSFSEDWQKDIFAFVRKDYNHPSVVLYSLGNEIPEAGNEHGAWLCRQIDSRIKELDDSRLTINGISAMLACSAHIKNIVADIMKDHIPTPSQDDGMDGVSALNNFASILHGPMGDAIFSHPIMTQALTPFKNATDITGLNYMPSRYGLEKQLSPDRLVLGTEEYPADIVALWELVEKMPHVIGDMTWTGWDYLGEAGIGIFYYDGTINFMPHWPDRLAYIGDIDILGHRRPISFLRETVYGLRTVPYIAVTRMERNGQIPSKTAWMYKDQISSWTWHGFEGQTAHVEIFSDAEEVELVLNGITLGIKPAGKGTSFSATFEVVYTPGTLEAFAIREGCRAERYALETADKHVQLVSERGSTINAHKGELLLLPIWLKDKQGRINMQSERMVRVSVTGNATLQAFGSAAPSGELSFDDTTWPTWGGQLMAAIRMNCNATGSGAKVLFEADGCNDLVIELKDADTL